MTTVVSIGCVSTHTGKVAKVYYRYKNGSENLAGVLNTDGSLPSVCCTDESELVIREEPAESHDDES